MQQKQKLAQKRPEFHTENEQTAILSSRQHPTTHSPPEESHHTPSVTFPASHCQHSGDKNGTLIRWQRLVLSMLLTAFRSPDIKKEGVITGCY